MRKMIIFGITVLFACSTAFSQAKTDQEPEIKRIELITPWVMQGNRLVPDSSRRQRSCFDLVRFEQFCGGAETLSYGNRIGKNWDIFAISGGRDSQTRMIDLGSHNWNETFTIPEIEPSAVLKPGETRNISINTSGADGKDGSDGADGMPGRNADGTYQTGLPSKPRSKPTRQKQTVDYANAPLTRQVTSTIRMGGKVSRNDNYTPLTEVKKGHMYLVRVVEPNRDHYVLLRVDDVVRGEKVVLSYINIPQFVVL